MIDKKLIHFNRNETFENNKNQIKDASIVFIKDADKIYTHGTEYQFVGWTVMDDKEESGGGEFYVDLYHNHPILGEQFYRTVTFVIDREKTWEEANGIRNTEGRFEIMINSKPSGEIIVLIQSVSDDEMDMDVVYLADNLFASDKIIIGHTYKFITE